MTRKTIMVCDYCDKESVSGSRERWISIPSITIYNVRQRNGKQDFEFCSKECISNFFLSSELEKRLEIGGIFCEWCEKQSGVFDVSYDWYILGRPPFGKRWEGIPLTNLCSAKCVQEYVENCNKKLEPLKEND